MSNKKLTTEEKIAKSKKITEEIGKIEKRLKERKDAQKKLNAEIEDELAKEELVTDQTVGRRFRKKIKEKLPPQKYEEIMDFMFMHEDCEAFIAEVIDKYKQELEAAEKAKREKAAAEENGEVAELVSSDESDNMGEDNGTAPTDEAVHLDESSISA